MGLLDILEKGWLENMNNDKSLINQISQEIALSSSELTLDKLRNLKSDLFEVFSKYTKIVPENLKLNVKMLWDLNIVFMVDCVAENVVFRSDKIG